MYVNTKVLMLIYSIMHFSNVFHSLPLGLKKSAAGERCDQN